MGPGGKRGRNRYRNRYRAVSGPGPLTRRMCAGPAVRLEYRRGLRRDHDRPGPEPSFAERLRQRLRSEPGLLAALQDDAAVLLSRALRGRPEPGPALRGLAAAFELLERAALNLYLYPWRSEFRSIQTFSGAYVHVLRAALPEAELLRSLARLGYTRLDQRRLAVRRPPPGSQLSAAACGFFACRIECDIMAELLLRLQPKLPSVEELLDARRIAGDVETCVEMLREAAPGRDNDRERYGDVPGCSEDRCLQRAHGPERGGERDVSTPALNKLQRDPAGRQGVHGRNWDGCERSELRQELLPCPAAPDPSSSGFLLQQEQGELGSSPPLLPELPSYQLHSCLQQGSLPAFCCTTCQQLHAGSCAAGLACRSRHRGQELRCERQQRLWLQRTEVDMLLADGTSTRP